MIYIHRVLSPSNRKWFTWASSSLVEQWEDVTNTDVANTEVDKEKISHIHVINMRWIINVSVKNKTINLQLLQENLRGYPAKLE